MNQLKLWFVFSLLLLLSIQVRAQYMVRGRIADENGEAMIGVSVFLKEDPTIGTSTDLDGQYSLSISSDDPKTLMIVYVSYETIEALIQVPAGDVLIQDFSMAPTSTTLTEVEVVAKQERRSQYYMETIKKKSASTLDYISGDLMDKIGDNNVAAAISRVTGVATNGNFITVRGLGDRYVQTCINASRIPTLDPFTNNIKMDLFPSSFVDNIIVTKTASPDLPGDWSAAYISIETKDYPDKLSILIETKIGFVPQTTFQDIIATETSSTDWLGFDNGFRDVDHTRFIPVNASPTPYQTLSALGLKDYYTSIGVISSWNEGSELGNTYFNLGLVQLGLLGKAFIKDEQSVNAAKAQYNAGSYQNDAFRIINEKAEQSLNQFANNWSPITKKAPLNFSQIFSVGNQTTLFGRPFGFLAGFRYGSSTQYDANSNLTRTITQNLDTLGNPFIYQQYHQQLARYIHGWTGLVNGNYKWDANNSFSFLFMPNVIGNNQIRYGVDQYRAYVYPYAFLQGQFYEERTQFIYQYRSEHYLPSIYTKIRLSASYTDGKSSAPDFKSLQYFSDDRVIFQLDKTISNVRRNFRYLDENVLDLKAEAEFPMSQKTGVVSKLKFGGSYMDRDREFVQYDYLLQLANGVRPIFHDENLDELFYDERFDIRTDTESGQNRIDLYYRRPGDPSFHTIGYSRVYAGFGMIDQSILRRIRLSTGLRIEYADLFTDVKLYSELGYTPDDLRRRSPEQSFTLTPSKIQKTNLLPSINVIYQLRSDELYPSNLRFNYSRTIARPSLREYSETIVRDFELNADVFGNADLEFVDINNYDFRYENYFKNTDFLSMSLFYKTFQNHIELTSSNIGFTWSNANESYVYGIELEGRKKLGKRFELRSNISAVHSFTRVDDRRLTIQDGIKTWYVVGVIERTMFGQAPYVINAILQYTAPRGFSGSMSYNLQGSKLVLTSIDEAPNIYEMPRHLLTAKVSHPIGRYFSVSITIKDVFNAPVRRAYKYDEGFLLDFDEYQYGTEFSLGVSYSL